MGNRNDRGGADDRLIEVDAAQHLVMSEVRPLGVERVTLLDALGRILREPVTSPHDVPERDNSAMDGYAVRAADLRNATPRSPVTLEIVADLPAGTVGTGRVEPGTAARIMTGALIPEGADAVAQIEITDHGADTVQIFEPVRAGAHIRRRGEDMVAGTTVLEPGVVIGAGEVGVLAGVRRSVVTVGRRPTVAIIATGDEIVEIDQVREPGSVMNSNSYALASLVREAGAIPRLMGIVRDSREAMVETIRASMDADVIVSSGGVSVGVRDFVKPALSELGAETRFWKVAMRPGKPLLFARLEDRLFFGLPGNPVSTMVSFILFIAPALRKAMGQVRGLQPPVVNARLTAPLRSRGDRRFFQRVRVVAREGRLIAIPMRAQGSGISTSMIAANGFAVLDLGQTSAEEGSEIPTVLFGPIAAE